MSANSYLERLATEGVIRDSEKVSIDKSLAILQGKLESYFSDAPLKKHFAFGSFTRGTLLPRNMDSQSDVDYIIVFTDSDSKPQTYLDRIRRFAEAHYQRSEIFQSNPTIILSMNHIRFELVPAIETFWSGIQIPAKKSSYSEWLTTTPNDFNDELTQKNKNNENLIKPLIRLVKYWNACNKYPFESFELEKWVVGYWTIYIALFGGNLWERFDAFMNQLSVFWADSEYKKVAIARAQEIIAEVGSLESQERFDEAEIKLCQLMPETG